MASSCSVLVRCCSRSCQSPHTLSDLSQNRGSALWEWLCPACFLENRSGAESALAHRQAVARCHLRWAVHAWPRLYYSDVHRLCGRGDTRGAASDPRDISAILCIRGTHSPTGGTVTQLSLDSIVPGWSKHSGLGTHGGCAVPTRSKRADRCAHLGHRTGIFCGAVALQDQFGMADPGKCHHWLGKVLADVARHDRCVMTIQDYLPNTRRPIPLQLAKHSPITSIGHVLL